MPTPTLWAAEPEKLQHYLQIVENATAEQVERAQALFGEQAHPDILSIDGETATIEIFGVLRKKPSPPILRFLGLDGTSYEQIIEAVSAIKDNDAVKRVVLAFDTPGGAIDGLDEAYQALADLAVSKEVTAEARGLLASAGYYLAATAKKITSTAPTNLIGSIGVVVAYTSWKKFDERVGIKEITITSKNASKKAPDIDSKEGQDVIQARVDALERIFYQRIAQGRGISVGQIAQRFGQGDVLVSQDPDPDKPDAMGAGMIDGLGALAAMQRTTPKQESMEVKVMPGLQELMAGDAGLKAEIEARDADNFNKGRQTGMAQVQAKITKVAPYLGAEGYPAAMRGLAVKVLTGESEFASLEGAVTMYDMQAEQAARDAAMQESEDTGETVPDGNNNPAPSADGTLNSEADFQASVKQARQEMGVGGGQ